MINLIIAGLLLPLVTSLLLFRRPRRPAGGWVATLVLSTGMTLFAFFAVPWGFLGMPLRWTVAAVFVIAVTVSLIRKPDERSDDSPTRMLLKILIGMFFGSVALSVIRANSQPPGAVDLAFPFARGTFSVLHGGSTTAANTYFGRGAEGFAVDLAGDINNELVSPCDGNVTSQKPLRIRCGDVDVEMTTAEALQLGPVRRGASVGHVTGDYLHLFASRNKQAVPVTFEGRWLVRNERISR